MLQRKKIIQSLIVIVLIMVIIVIGYRPYILSFEPDKTRGHYYNDLANYHSRMGDKGKSDLYLHLSKRYYPQLHKKKHISTSKLEENINILKNDPHNWEALNFVANQYVYNLWDCNSAMSYLKTAISIKPVDAQSHFNLGSCYLFQEKYELALEELELAHSLNPKSGHYIANLNSARNHVNKADQ